MKISGVMRRAIVCLLLVVVGCTGAVEEWRAQLGDPDPAVRRAAIRALEASPDAAAELPALEHALDDGDASVRVAAALVIQKIAPRNTSYEWAIPTLIALLSDRRASIRALAARTLGDVGLADSRVESALQRSLRDSRPAVRKAAQQAQKKIQSRYAGAAQ
jgi:HEAT repeat protein